MRVRPVRQMWRAVGMATVQLQLEQGRGDVGSVRACVRCVCMCVCVCARARASSLALSPEGSCALGSGGVVEACQWAAVLVEEGKCRHARAERWRPQPAHPRA